MKTYEWLPELEPIKQGIRLNIKPVYGTIKGCGCKKSMEKLEEEVKELDKQYEKSKRKKGK